MFDLHYDPVKRAIFVQATGFHTMSEVQVFMRDCAAATAQSRADCGEVKILVDATDTVVQSDEVMGAFNEADSWAPEPNDRMALLVTSSLAKMQASRSFKNEREKAFVSRDAAWLWLMATREGDRRDLTAH